MERREFQNKRCSVKNLLSGYVDIKPETDSENNGRINENIIRQLSGLPPLFDIKRGISHTQRIYHSFKEARETLDSNREIFDRVMERLNRLEEKKYQRAIALTNNHLASLKSIKLHQHVPLHQPHKRNHSVGMRKDLQSLSLPSIPGLESIGNNFRSDGAHCAVTKILQRRIAARLPYRWIRCSLKGWHAETREGGTLTTLTIESKENAKEQRAYLFGGLSRELYSNLVYLKLNPDKTGYEWVYEKIGEPQLKRYAHAACAWDDKLLIISGSKLYTKESKRRECLDDAYIFDPCNREWTKLKWTGSIYPRRYHVCCAVGKHVLIHGGIDTLEKYVSDSVVLHLGRCSENGSFSIFPLHSKGAAPLHLSNHSCNLVTESFPSKYAGLYTNIHEGKNQDETNFLEGIYLFGGKNETGPQNTLHVLKIGKKPCVWMQPLTRGEPPCPRYGHSSVYIPEKKILVIFGGRNDANYGTPIPAFLNDIWIFNIKALEWSQWNYQHYVGYLPEGRYSHCAALLDKEMILFGGLGEDNYCRSEVLTFQIDPKASQLTDKEKSESEPVVLEEADCFPLLTQKHC